MTKGGGAGVRTGEVARGAWASYADRTYRQVAHEHERRT